MTDPKLPLQTTHAGLLKAASAEERAESAIQLADAARAFSETHAPGSDLDTGEALVRDALALRRAGSRLADMADQDLATFNQLLPWAAPTVDPKGRQVGQVYAPSKRSKYNALIDKRISAFDNEMSLSGQHVLEVWCFEGIHTIGCLLHGARVTAVDGRIGNILKTLARLWAYQQQAADLVLWNLERDPPSDLPEEWDILHHIGVLYHLTNPVEHLDFVLPKTRKAIILDTHIARDQAECTDTYRVGDREYPYRRADERHAATSPFAGMQDHAKWLRLEDLHVIVRRNGFQDVRTVEDRDERNGRRVLIWGFR